MASSKYDFIIVGAGAAGCSLASGLARCNPNVSVLLLEAGGEASDPAITIPTDRFRLFQNPHAASLERGYKSVVQPQLNGRELPYFRGKGLGGTTLLNGAVWDYGSKPDFNEWASLVGDEAWSWERASERMKKIENYHIDPPTPFDHYFKIEPGSHGTAGPIDVSVPSWEPGFEVLLDAAKEYGLPCTTDLNNGQGLGIGVAVFSCHRGRRLTAASAYLSNKPDTLTVLADSPVTRILFKGKKAIGVEALSGLQYFAARDVIVSAGVIDTPKLLLLSGIGPAYDLEKHGISIISDIPGIGKGFRDHILVTMAYTIKGGAIETSAPYDRMQAEEQWLKDRSGPLGKLGDNCLMGYLKLPQDCKVDTWPEFQSLPERVRGFLARPDVADWELFVRIQPPLPDGTIKLSCINIGMHAQSRGIITLKSADPEDPPVIDLQYLSHPYDQRVMIESIKAVCKFVENSSIPTDTQILGPKSSNDDDLLAYCKNATHGALHGLGTAKMGKIGEKDTCVDRNFRVLGVENLRVVDTSVCSVVPCNHTQSTAYLIGVTAAEKIIQEYQLEIM